MTKPHNLQDLIKLNWDKTTKLGGIYIWGVKVRGKYIPLYVGKSKKIPQRIYEHLCAWRGGAYTIPSWKDIADENKKWAVLYSPKSFKDFLKLQNNTHAQKTLKNVERDFFCCWEAINVDQTRMRIIERDLAGLISKNNGLISHKIIETADINKVDIYAKEFFENWQKMHTDS